MKFLFGIQNGYIEYLRFVKQYLVFRWLVGVIWTAREAVSHLGLQNIALATFKFQTECARLRMGSPAQ